MGKVIHKLTNFRTVCGLFWSPGCNFKSRTHWNRVTCASCKRSEPKPVVHYAACTRTEYSPWLTKCGLNLKRVSLDVLIRDHWKGVTCGNCLRHKPKRRKR